MRIIDETAAHATERRTSASLKHQCPDCGHVAEVRIETNGNGRLIETGRFCEHELRRRGFCIDCGRPVSKGRMRCRADAKLAAAKQMKESEARRRAGIRPTCEGCGAEMDTSGHRGRPPKRCVECDPARGLPRWKGGAS